METNNNNASNNNASNNNASNNNASNHISIYGNKQAIVLKQEKTTNQKLI